MPAGHDASVAIGAAEGGGALAGTIRLGRMPPWLAEAKLRGSDLVLTSRPPFPGKAPERVHFGAAGPDGRFRFAAIPSGRYALAAIGADGAPLAPPLDVDVVAGAETAVDLDLPADATSDSRGE